MSSYKAGDAYAVLFTTSNPTTGAAQNADSLPVATANRNGTDDAGFVLTVANLDTGRYKATGTIPGGYAAGDVLHVSVAATVAGVAAKAVIDGQVLDARRLADGVVLANGVAHGGALGSSTATLSLERINVTCQTANQPAVRATGQGSGAGLDMEGGASGPGLVAVGGASGGDGVQAVAQGISNVGLKLLGSGLGSGLFAQGGSQGSGVAVTGGATSGAGMTVAASAPNTPGLALQGSGAADLSLAGSGLLQGDLGGRILGGTATAFVGVGVQAVVAGYAAGQDPGTLVSAITVAGQTLPAALRHIGATVAGKVSGAGSGVESFSAFDGSVAVVITVGSDGNRTNVVYA